MVNEVQAPAMTSHKAIVAAIASLFTSIALSLAGLMPTSEEILTRELQQLVENVAALIILLAVPGISTWWKRNRVK